MGDTLTVVLTSGVVATLAGSLTDLLWQRRRQGQSTKFNALRAAVLLEGYAITCANRIADHAAAESSEGHGGKYLASVPPLPELHVNAEFVQRRKAAVASALLNFPQTVAQADQAAMFWWDVVGDLECARNAAVQQSGKVGVESISLAQETREAFGLPPRDLVFGKFDVEKILREASHAQR